MRSLLAVVYVVGLAQGCDNSAFRSSNSSGGAGTDALNAGSRAGTEMTGGAPEEGRLPNPGMSPGGAQNDPSGGGAEGDAESNNDAGSNSDGGVGGAAEGPRTCKSTHECARGENCIDEVCEPALPTCAAQKNRYAASKDGVYWVGRMSDVHLAYCDMDEAVELCSDVEGEHRGRTRDSSKIPYVMTSLLLPNEGLCKMWAIRAVSDGHPFGQLEAVAGVAAGQTCAKLGFVSDGTLGVCSFGSERSTCGFSGPFFRYGNSCSAACGTTAGTFDHYILQGPMLRAGTLSTFSGSTATTCKTAE